MPRLMNLAHRRLLSLGITTVAAVLLMSGAAQAAPQLSIVAEAVCVSDGTVVISYTAAAGEAPSPYLRENDHVDILLNGVLADTGGFASPDYSFSGALAAPAGSGSGDPVLVTVRATGNWDPDGLGGGPFPGGQSSSVTVYIPTEGCVQPGLGRFTGGGHQIRVDNVRVTRGLTIHCDLLLSNNLEINWNGNQFHMTEHMTTVACTDDPDIIQAPPAAPLDTLVGVGTGRYNNMDGYTVEFTLQDAGEPGVNDKMAILIYETANPGNVILDVPLQYLTGGNLQAHYDQPHGSNGN